MQQFEPLTFGNYYHIYNRGINGSLLFQEKDNYKYFIELYDKHITPVAETLAWVLMPNHFHFLVKIRDEHLSGFQNLTGVKPKPPHQHFSNLFNAYSKAFNKRYHRHGSLFERPFKRKLIEGEDSLRNVLVYIHNNPVHHGFSNLIEDYPWNSYLEYLSGNPSKLPYSEVMKLFSDCDNFRFVHEEKSKKERDLNWDIESS